jgi:hypothetical protein
MDSAMLQKLDAAVDDFAAKWSSMFYRCANCGAQVPAAAPRQQFAAELKPLIGGVIDALHSDVDTLQSEENAKKRAADPQSAIDDAEKSERDALAAAQLAGATVEAIATMEHPESEADRIERDALTSAAIDTESPDAGETIRTGG